MSKKVLIISTSLRKGSNSEQLARAFAQGAVEAGHQVEQIPLAGKDIHFCRGCLACQETQECVIHDDASRIAEKMLTADVLEQSKGILCSNRQEKWGLRFNPYDISRPV